MSDNKNIDHFFLWDHEYDFFFRSKKRAFGSVVVTFTSLGEIATDIKGKRKNGTYLYYISHVQLIVIF